MLLAPLSKIILGIFVCFIKIKQGSLQTEIDNQIRSIAEDIRLYRFALAQEQILKLKDNDKVAQIIHEVYQNKEDSFDDIMKFVKALTRVDLTFYVLRALRNEMQANGHLDPLKLIPLAKEFGQGVVFQKNNDPYIKGESEKIIKEIRTEVKNLATDILTRGMLTNDYFLNGRVENVASEIFNFYHTLSDEVIREMVNRTYPFVPAIEIVETVMRSSNFLPQKVSVLLAVFSMLEANNNLDNEAVLEIASCVDRLKGEENYENLFHNKKYEVNVMVDKMPMCARNLYLAGNICIWNRGKMEYLYAGNMHKNSSERNVYTCPPEALKTGEGSWIVETFFDNLLFKSEAYKKEYLGVSNIKYRLLGRLAQTEETIPNDNQHNNWKVELSGEYCFIRNQNLNQYLYASNEKYSARDRHVFSAIAGTINVDPIDFQWQIRNCG